MKTSPKRWLWHIPLLLAAATMMLPLAFMISTALSSGQDTLNPAASVHEIFLPQEWRWANFITVWRIVPFLRYYLNSLFVAGCVTAGQVATSACAAYAFARLSWPGRDKLFLAYLATIMVPHSVTMIPNFVLVKMLPEWLSHIIPTVDWLAPRYLGTSEQSPGIGRLIGLDSYFALIVPGMFSAYGTFLLRQFMLGLPRELEEAAKIDGCSYWQLFSRIIFPLSLPGIAALALFTFMGSWASLLWPLVTTNQDALHTLPLALQAFQGQYGTEWHLMMAAAVLMLAPIVVVFLLGQRFFISGLTAGALRA